MRLTRFFLQSSAQTRYGIHVIQDPSISDEVEDLFKRFFDKWPEVPLFKLYLAYVKYVTLSFMYFFSFTKRAIDVLILDAKRFVRRTSLHSTMSDMIRTVALYGTITFNFCVLEKR